MQSYFEKFGEVEHCYCAMKKETNKCKGYGFVAFRAAATADEVQRTRPHTLMVRCFRVFTCTYFLDNVPN